jgi:peptidoglycan/LPS O-acetylase OafA/YrhL
VVGVSHMRHLFLDRGGIENTALAVDFFFILSRFVLAHAYADKLNAGATFRTTSLGGSLDFTRLLWL